MRTAAGVEVKVTGSAGEYSALLQSAHDVDGRPRRGDVVVHVRRPTLRELDRAVIDALAQLHAAGADVTALVGEWADLVAPYVAREVACPR